MSRREQYNKLRQLQRVQKSNPKLNLVAAKAALKMIQAIAPLSQRKRVNVLKCVSTLYDLRWED